MGESRVDAPTTCTYKTVGDCELKCDVYLPAGVSGPAPTIVLIHGGALINSSRKSFEPAQLQPYLDAGYVLALIDYRLAPESKLPDIIDDLQDAFRWVAESGPDLFHVNPRAIAAVGYSAGGYLALMSGCCAEPRPQAIVSFYGYGDLIGDWYTKPDPYYCSQDAVAPDKFGDIENGPVISEPTKGRAGGDFYLYCRQQGLWTQTIGGCDPSVNPSFFTPYCPVQNVSANYPPTLLLHGDADMDVPYQQSVMMAEELARHDIEHELITIPGGGHGFDNDLSDPLIQDAFTRVMAFLDKHIGSRLE